MTERLKVLYHNKCIDDISSMNLSLSRATFIYNIFKNKWQVKTPSNFLEGVSCYMFFVQTGTSETFDFQRFWAIFQKK